MRKRILAFCLILTALWSLTACGNNITNGGSVNDLPPDTSQTEPPPVAAPPAENDSPPAEPVPQQPAEPEEPYIRTVDPEKPMVAITFDDGPHSEYTDQILDILEENRAVATFFQLGRNLKNDPDAVLRAIELGCEIGSHSYRHDDLGKLGAEAIAADLQLADEAFIRLTGAAPTLLRPPYGSLNYYVRATTGRSLITWSVDPQDWLSRDAAAVIAAVQAIADLNGEVILLHDTHATTVEAVRGLVPWLQEQGYQLVTVTELLTLHYGDEPVANGLYSFPYFRYGKAVEMPPSAPPAAAPVPPAQEQPGEEIPGTTPPDGETLPGEEGVEPTDPGALPDPPSAAPPADPSAAPPAAPTEPMPPADDNGTEVLPDPDNTDPPASAGEVAA